MRPETADNGSSGAPWLCQPAPASIVPKTVMPCQANWHFEAIKFQASVHSVGADSTVAGGAFVGMMSAAHTSTAYETTATANITASRVITIPAIRAVVGRSL